MVSGKLPPSQMLKQLSARPRKHDLAIAMREIGRIERTLYGSAVRERFGTVQPKASIFVLPV